MVLPWLIPAAITAGTALFGKLESDKERRREKKRKKKEKREYEAIHGPGSWKRDTANGTINKVSTQTPEQQQLLKDQIANPITQDPTYQAGVGAIEDTLGRERPEIGDYYSGAKNPYENAQDYYKDVPDQYKDLTDHYANIEGKNPWDNYQESAYNNMKDSYGGLANHYNDYQNPYANMEDPYNGDYWKNFETPYMEHFNKETIPGLLSQYGAMGTGAGSVLGSSFQNSLSEAAKSLELNLASKKSEKQFEIDKARAQHIQNKTAGMAGYGEFQATGNTNRDLQIAEAKRKIEEAIAAGNDARNFNKTSGMSDWLQNITKNQSDYQLSLANSKQAAGFERAKGQSANQAENLRGTADFERDIRAGRAGTDVDRVTAYNNEHNSALQAGLNYANQPYQNAGYLLNVGTTQHFQNEPPQPGFWQGAATGLVGGVAQGVGTYVGNNMGGSKGVPPRNVAPNKQPPNQYNPNNYNYSPGSFGYGYQQSNPNGGNYGYGYNSMPKGLTGQANYFSNMAGAPGR